MAIIRVVKDKDNPYVIKNKHATDNPSISFKATGILDYLLSKPDNWKVYEADLAKRKTDSRHSVRTGINELINAGYITRAKKRDEKGRFKGYHYTVYEVPHRVRFSDNGKTDIGKSDSSNNDLSNYGSEIINECTYTVLPDDDNFIAIYKAEYKKRLGKEHPRVTKQTLEDIMWRLEQLHDCDLQEAEFHYEAVEHLDNLPKSNNGNIAAFLKASMRHFDIDTGV